MMKSSCKTIALLGLFALFQLSFDQTLAQNYFPLDVGFQWEYKKVITNTTALNLLKRSSTTNLKKKIVTASNTNKSKLEGFDIDVETIDTSEPDKTLYEHYTVISEPDVVEFYATNYTKITETHGIEESSIEYFDPPLRMDFARAVGDTITFSGILTSDNHDFLKSDKALYVWYYQTFSRILPKESIVADGINYTDCYKTETNWQLIWAPRSVYNNQNPEPAGTEYDSWKTVAWYAPDVGLVKRDTDGKGFIELVTTSTAITENTLALPKTIELLQNFPNPFNAGTEISYQLFKPGHIRLVLFNASGQEVRTLVDTEQRAGIFEVRWDGRDDFGRQVSSGLYFYTLRTGENSDTRKALYLR